MVSEYIWKLIIITRALCKARTQEVAFGKAYRFSSSYIPC